MERLNKKVPQAELSGFAADVGDVTAVNQLIASVPQADIPVSNAGPTESKFFLRKKPDGAWVVYRDANLLGPE